MFNKTMPLDPQYTKTHHNMFTLLQNDLPSPTTQLLNINVHLTQSALITEKQKHSNLPVNERPKYVLFFNEPIASGTYGSASFGSMVWKYDANNWATPIKIKFSSRYLIKSIKLNHHEMLKYANLEFDFNNLLKGSTFLPFITDKMYYMPLKREPGMTLQALLKILKVDADFLTPLQYYALAHSLIEDLANIHKNNLIHCDIKPANILVDLDTLSMRLVDFGLMKKVGVFSGFVGTPKYSDPLCLIKENDPDQISDIFSAVLCLLKLFGQYERDVLTTDESFIRDAEDINTHRLGVNISHLTPHEKRMIQSTLKEFSRFSRDVRLSDLTQLKLVFNNLMLYRIQNPEVSLFEKINSTKTLITLENLGIDAIINCIENKIHLLNISVVECLIPYGLNLKETDAISLALRQPRVELFKIRRLHELGAVFSESCLHYWLNERQIDADNIQAWAEICLYLYTESHYPNITTELTPSNCEEKRVFLTYFFNSDTPWQDATIGKKIKQHIQLSHIQTQILTSLTDKLTSTFKDTHFATIIKNKIEQHKETGLLSQNTHLSALQNALDVCQNFTHTLNECEKLIKQYSESPIIEVIKALKLSIQMILADSSQLSLSKYLINHNLFKRILNDLSKKASLIEKVAPFTTTPINTLTPSDIEYCITLDTAIKHVNWYSEKQLTLNSSYLYAIQSLIIDETYKFKPGNLNLVQILPLKLFSTFTNTIEEIYNLKDNQAINKLLIDELPILLDAVTEKNINEITKSYQSLLNNLKKSNINPASHPLSNDYNGYKLAMLEDITTIFPDNIAIIIQRLKRFNDLNKDIIHFLEKIALTYHILKNTAVWGALKLHIDSQIINLLINNNSNISHLNTLLTKAEFLEKIVINSDNYETRWHKQILFYCAQHIIDKQPYDNSLTLNSYNGLQRNVSAYLTQHSTPNESILECIGSFIHNNDLDSAIRVLTVNKRPASLVFWNNENKKDIKKNRTIYCL